MTIEKEPMIDDLRSRGTGVLTGKAPESRVVPGPLQALALPAAPNF